MPEGKVLVEGKRCKIEKTEDAGLLKITILDRVWIRFADGSNVPFDLPGGGMNNAKINNFCFRLLETKGIRTHFRGSCGKEAFLATPLCMIPIEVVVRRFSIGSFVERHPFEPVGTRFEPPKIELFLKSEDEEDYLLFWDEKINAFHLHDAHTPSGQGFKDKTITTERIISQGGKMIFSPGECFKEMKRLARTTFLILEEAWIRQGIVLQDLKVEMGFDYRGELAIGDVFSNECWRLVKDGRRLDENAFDSMTVGNKQMTLNALLSNTRRVAEMSAAFFGETI